MNIIEANRPATTLATYASRTVNREPMTVVASSVTKSQLAQLSALETTAYFAVLRHMYTTHLIIRYINPVGVNFCSGYMYLP